jgi:hypothetical protein
VQLGSERDGEFLQPLKNLTLMVEIQKHTVSRLSLRVDHSFRQQTPVNIPRNDRLCFAQLARYWPLIGLLCLTSRHGRSSGEHRSLVV